MIIKSVTKKNRTGLFWFLAGIVLIAGAGYITTTYWFAHTATAPVTENQFPVSGGLQDPQLVNLDSTNNSTTPLPESKLLPVPFTPQAPTANWDELHNEACEEADSLMAGAYFAGNRETTLASDFVESEITKLTDWQKKNFGYYLDITSSETAVMITKVYGLKTKVIQFPSSDDIKRELANGNIVIFSANGQKLGNPNYKQPGPIHHMLLLKGYDKTGFITNDSGTKKGLNYAYDYDTLLTSAADWDHTINTVDETKKLAIIVSQK